MTTNTTEIRNRPIRSALAPALLCAFVLGAFAGPAPAAVKHREDISKLKDRAVEKTTETVKRKLPRDKTPGLEPSQAPIKINVSSCKPQLKGDSLKGFKCAWGARGELPGRVLLRSNGVAKVDAKATVARVGKVENETEIQAPLLEDPHPVDFGYFEDFTQIPGLFDYASPEASGASIIREGITWRVLQPVEDAPPSRWRWDQFDDFYNTALARGLKPIFTFRNPPCWAAIGPCSNNQPDPPDPAHFDDFAYAAAQIAARYPEAYAIELFFEANNANMWGGKPDPVAFSTAVGLAADAIHAVSPAMTVYAGGLAPGQASPAKYFYGKYIADALDAGGVERADVITFHAVTEVPYQRGKDPTKSYLGRLRIQAQWLLSAIADRGLTMPIAFTQLSYSTGAATYPYTEAQQGEALAASYDLIRHIPNTESVIVSRLYDNGDGSKVQGFGTLRADRTPKPAYCDLARARGVTSAPGC